MPMPLPSRPRYLLLVLPVRTTGLSAPVICSSALAVREVVRLGTTETTSLRAAKLATCAAGSVAVTARRPGMVTCTEPPAPLMLVRRSVISASRLLLVITTCTWRWPLMLRAHLTVGVVGLSSPACRSRAIFFAWPLPGAADARCPANSASASASASNMNSVKARFSARRSIRTMNLVEVAFIRVLPQSVDSSVTKGRQFGSKN